MKLSEIVLLTVSVGFLASCGGSSSSSGVSTISSLPAATAAVATSGSAVLKPAATTGVVLKDLNNVTWTTGGKSRALCETGAITKNLLRETGRNDKIQCYIGVMEANALFTASYDGTDKYYSLPSGEDGATTMKIKFNIASSGGVITNFKMWTCEDGSTQSQYLSTENSNNTVSITAVNKRNYGSGGSLSTFGNRATVTGTINSSGTWISKTMTSALRGTRTGGEDSSAYASIEQGATSMTISGFRTGSDGTHSFSTALYGVSEILNASSLSTFAIGDGSMKYSATFGGTSVNENTVSWLGDTQARLVPASSGTYYSQASAGTLPTIATQSIAFSGSEVWDCAPATEFTVIPASGFTDTVNTALAACDTKYSADSDRNFTDCHGGDD